MPAIKGGQDDKHIILRASWGAIEDANNKIATEADGNETIGLRAGIDTATVEAAEYVEVENKEDVSENAVFQNVKFYEQKATLRSTNGSTPQLANLAIKTTPTFASFILNPNTRKIYLVELDLAEEISGFVAVDEFLLKEDGDFILTEDGDKIILE